MNAGIIARYRRIQKYKINHEKSDNPAAKSNLLEILMQAAKKIAE
jgi:hypothetical protein